MEPVTGDSGAEASEWEYEYDDTQTEDVYFTLDLTTFATSNTLSGKAKTKAKANKASAGNTTAPNTPAPTPNTQQAQQQSEVPSTDESAGTLQVFDLHTDNPLILFNHSLYSCHWSDTHGSQFYIAARGTVQSPLREGHVVDVVGLSSAKLIGKPTILKQKPDQTAPGGSVETAIAIEEAVTSSPTNNTPETNPEAATISEPSETAQQHFATLRSKATNPELKASASFLERLSILKQQRGETDSIPTKGVKVYLIPEATKDEIRAAAKLGKKKATPKKTATPKPPMVRGPYKKRTPKENGTDRGQPNPKRRKPGPQSAEEVRNALGIGGSGDSVSRPLGSGSTMMTSLHALNETPQPFFAGGMTYSGAQNDAQPFPLQNLQPDVEMTNGATEPQTMEDHQGE